ncbi:MAG: undecaprenyl-diphosphate phosphatase [Chitinispirillaceae bacterium]|nr:undecaprenyl-diphosphate phosphatase [Chitinispirillaceae bacterium]
MNDFINAVILGLVEGLTEFLPVSSTGHLLIVQGLLKSHQSDAFNILIQIGPIVAVTLVFWKYILGLFTGIGNPEKRSELVMLAVSFLLTGIGGLIAKKLGLELPETVVPIAIATLIGGGVIFLVEHHTKDKKLNDTVTWGVAIAVAFGQLLAAVFPGTSRSGAAVMAALALGLARPAAVRFAFLVGIPTMFAAGAYQLKEMLDVGQAAQLFTPYAITAFVVATITAWVSVVWLLKFVQTRNFIPFVWYRFGLGLLLIVLLVTKVVQ